MTAKVYIIVAGAIHSNISAHPLNNFLSSFSFLKIITHEMLFTTHRVTRMVETNGEKEAACQLRDLKSSNSRKLQKYAWLLSESNSIS